MMPRNSALIHAPVWDLTTRVWHWALAISVTVGWCLGEFRSFSTVEWHFYFGYATGSLLAFRYAWGFVGPAPIRHSTLLMSIFDVFHYLRCLKEPAPSGMPGHNPLGALSVFAILFALTIQVISGLFSEDDGLFSAGPFATEVGDEVVRKMTLVHNFGARVVLGLLGLHVVAIIFYAFYKRENLTFAMITGRKLVRREKN